MGMIEVVLRGAEPTEDERSKLRAHVAGMHCVPLAAVYAAYVATCLMRDEVVEDMATFETRLRRYLTLGQDPGVWADRPIIFEGIVYGVWFDDLTKRFVVDLTATAKSRGTARSDANPPMSVDTIATKPTGKFTRVLGGIRRRQPSVSTRALSHSRQTATSNRRSASKKRANA